MKLHKALLLKLIVTSTLVGVLLWYVDLDQVFSCLSQIPWHIALIAMLLFSGQMFLATFRWFYILNTSKKVSFSKILELNLLATFAQNIFLGFIGASLMKIGLVKRLNVPISTSTIAFIMDRLVILFTLLLMVAITLPFTPKIPDFSVSPFYLLGGGVLLVTFCIFFLKKIPLVKRLPYQKYLPVMSLSLSKTVIKMLFVSIGSLFLYFIGIYIIGRYLDVGISFKNILIVMPIITLITSLPISINGWGVRESVMIIGFGLFGVTKENALALSIFVGILTLLSLIPLAVPAMIYRNRSSIRRIVASLK